MAEVAYPEIPGAVLLLLFLLADKLDPVFSFKILSQAPFVFRGAVTKVAKAAVRASIGSLLGENHPGFHRAVENQVLKESQERYPLHTPLTDLWEKRVKTEADRILKVMVIRNYGLLKSQSVGDSP